ncbi:arginine decarboxylase [Heyndrickxia sporothermodurans]|nr:arginine decarboxylase [Heyndrickxia sporothermodurans]
MNQNRIPLYEALKDFNSKHPISFHVPGHKHGLLFQDSLRDFSQILKYDVTELSGLDDLHSPEGAILEAQKLLSTYYGTKRSYFLVNGSTVGNLIMVLSVFRPGDTVFVQRNCHKSILNALKLGKVNPIFLDPEFDESLWVAGGVGSSTVEEAYHLYPDAKGCILTYPNYYGLASSLEKTINIVHQNRGLVLVDEAHGPHLRLGYPFPKSSIEFGADIIVQSAHKILPAMTMGSYLHINSEFISTERVEYYYSVLQSSSPSYPIMTSLDYARYFISTFTSEDIQYTLRQRDRFVDDLKKIKGILVANGIVEQDPLKLIIRYQGYSGYELQHFFEEEKIFVEMADPYQVVMVLPLLKKDMTYFYKDTIEKLKKVLNRHIYKINPTNRLQMESKQKINHLAMSYEEMEIKPIEWVSFDQALDRVAAKMIIPYPPGIPVILPGEIIDANKIAYIEKLIQNQARFQGNTYHILNKEIAVFKK